MHICSKLGSFIIKANWLVGSFIHAWLFLFNIPVSSRHGVGHNKMIQNRLKFKCAKKNIFQDESFSSRMSRGGKDLCEVRVAGNVDQ